MLQKTKQKILMYEILHWLWSFLLTKFMAHLASFLLKIMFVFSNTLSIVKVMHRNSNLTQFDMLTLSSSNMTASTLKTIEHLKKRTNNVFYLHFANSNLKVIFLTLSLEHHTEIISYLESTQNLCVHLHFHTVMTVKKVAKNRIYLKILTFNEPDLTVEIFGFSPAGPKTKAIHQLASNRA